MFLCSAVWEGVLASQVGVGVRGPAMMVMMVASGLGLVFEMITSFSLLIVKNVTIVLYWMNKCLKV